MKTCQTCNIEKSLDEFHNRAKAKDGKQTRCKDCNKAQRKAYYKTAHGKAKNNATSIAYNRGVRTTHRHQLYEYLLAHPCVDCGEADPIVLEFDHLDPSEKLFDVARACRNGYRWDKVLAEIKKCVVRCANCHKRRTAEQFGWYKFKRSLGV